MVISLSAAQALFTIVNHQINKENETATYKDGYAVNQDRFGRLILLCQTSGFKDFTN
jgi:hypothetical protein